MNTSEQINEISAALAKAQGELENATKNAQNPHFRNDYADLGEVLSTVRPVLSKNGIAIVQMSSIEGDAMILHTRLCHTSGQWFECVHPIAKLPEKPQIIGANETYARRYSLAAICGIGQQDDDLSDGKRAGIAAAPVQETRHDRELRRRELVTEGEARANSGMVPLENWWKSTLTKEERDLIGQDTLVLLKSVAQETEKTLDNIADKAAE